MGLAVALVGVWWIGSIALWLWGMQTPLLLGLPPWIWGAIVWQLILSALLSWIGRRIVEAVRESHGA
ncbi:MAG: hypothetical protein NZ960_04070 [Candidatus Kapabacteria bacterium]|nr:hypothetical protein [Candidatus Kapabacteria bacterium]